MHLCFLESFVQALTLFFGFCHSLRYLNVSANKLENLPTASLSEDSFSSLEELYVTNNNLTDKCVPLLSGHGHLRVLHLAYNQLQTFTARYASASDIKRNRFKPASCGVNMITPIAHFFL